jgi:hypothetical protein
MPELARKRADGVIDRSEARDTPDEPVAVCAGRPIVWNSRRGNHLGQRSCATAYKGRTYDRKRSDQKSAQQSCEAGAVHILGPPALYRPMPRRGGFPGFLAYEAERQSRYIPARAKRSGGNSGGNRPRRSRSRRPQRRLTPPARRVAETARLAPARLSAPRKDVASNATGPAARLSPGSPQA